MERRAGSTTSASLQLWVPCWTFLCHRRTEQEHPATKCWSAVSTASGLSLHRPNALWSWHSHRSLLEAPQSCSFKMKLQTSDLVVVNASFSHGAKTCLVINARPKVQPVSEICFCSLAPLWSSAPFPAKCEWPQAAPPSVGTLRARLSPSLPGLSSTPDTHMQAQVSARLRRPLGPSGPLIFSQATCVSPISIWLWGYSGSHSRMRRGQMHRAASLIQSIFHLKHQEENKCQTLQLKIS